MLLIVFALRLLKSNRKPAKYEHDPSRGFFNLFQEKKFSEKIKISLESQTPELQLKEIFRKIIRPKEESWQQSGNLYDDFFATLSTEERLVYVATVFDKNFQKGSIFNFLWHKTEWIVAFGQILKYTQNETLFAHYQQVIYQTTGFDLAKLDANDTQFFTLDLHPDGSQEFESVKQFDATFNRNAFFSKIINFALA